MDFLASMSSETHGELVMLMAARAKPSNQMTAEEWAEWEVLDAWFHLAKKQAALLYVRAGGVPA